MEVTASAPPPWVWTVWPFTPAPSPRQLRPGGPLAQRLGTHRQAALDRLDRRPPGRAVLSVLTDQPARPWPGCSRRTCCLASCHLCSRRGGMHETRVSSVPGLSTRGLFVVGGSVRPGRDGCALDGYDQPWGDRHGV